MSLPDANRYRIKIDVITANLIALAIFILCFGLTWGDPLSILCAILLSVGLGGCVFFETITWDLFLNKKERFQIVLWLLIDMGVVFAMNIAVKKVLPFQSIGEIAGLGGIVIGVAEELLFGILATAWFWRMTRGNIPLTLLLVSMMFMAYHFFVYRSDWKALAIVFGGRMVLSGSVLQTQRATSTTVAHGLINFVSELGRIFK